MAAGCDPRTGTTPHRNPDQDKGDGAVSDAAGLEQPEHDRANKGKRDIRGDCAQPICESHGLLRVCVALPALRTRILALGGHRKKTAALSVVLAQSRLARRTWLKIREINVLISL